MYLKIFMKYVIIILLITGSTNVFAQSLAINTDGSTADGSSILDVKSTVKGILIPRMSKDEKFYTCARRRAVNLSKRPR